MRVSFTLSSYIGKQVFIAIMGAFIGLMLLILLIDFVELLRRASGKEQIPFHVILELLLLKIPYRGGLLLPFAVLIGSMQALARLTRSNELVSVRAAGVSVWQFLLPGVLVALAIGVFNVTVFNPVSAAMLSRYEQLENKYLVGRPSMLAVSSSGLWIRQIEERDPKVREYVIHAPRIAQKDMRLYNVIVFIFGDNSMFLGRLDAGTAKLEKGFWIMNDVRYSQPGQLPQVMENYKLPTDLTLTQIQDSFASPMTLSFWQLPAFVNLLEKAGFSAIRHKLHWHALLASPVLLSAMVLLAALFSLRLPRRGGVTWLIIGGVATGFGVHFANDLIRALGESGSLPVELAAWSPALVAGMAGIGLLLHYEDG